MLRSSDELSKLVENERRSSSSSLRFRADRAWILTSKSFSFSKWVADERPYLFNFSFNFRFSMVKSSMILRYSSEALPSRDLDMGFSECRLYWLPRRGNSLLESVSSLELCWRKYGGSPATLSIYRSW